MNAKQSDTLDQASLNQLATEALQRYPAAFHGSLSLLCRSENATFRVQGTEGLRFAMRLHRGDYHQRDEIESELTWLDALRETGIMVPQSIAGLDGHRVQTLAVNATQTRNVTLFHWIDGEMPTTDVDPRAFAQLGEVTARLHQHSRQWQKPAAFRR